MKAKESNLSYPTGMLPALEVEDQSTKGTDLKEDYPRNPRGIGTKDQDLQMMMDLMMMGQMMDLMDQTTTQIRLAEGHREETMEEGMICLISSLPTLGHLHQQSLTPKARLQSGNGFSRWKSGSKLQASPTTQK